MKKLIIIPAYNESKNIEYIIHKLKKKAGYDFIIINDGSTDETSLLCKKYNINLIDLPENLGIGGAVQTGYKYAYNNNYDVAIQLDADGQHDPDFLDLIIKPIEEGEADYVIGSRFINFSGYQSSRLRRIGIVFLSLLIRIIYRKRITDPTSGFRAASKKTIKSFCVNYPIDYPEPESIAYLLHHGYKIKEIPVRMEKRIAGNSSITFFQCIYYMAKVSLAIIIKSTNYRTISKGDS